jgi:phosphate transport system permease protein
VLGLAALGWVAARGRALAFARAARGGAAGARPHSLPYYHGWYVALWAAIPAILFIAIWSPISGNLVMDAVMGDPAAATLPPFEMQKAAILRDARDIAEGAKQASFHPQAKPLAAVWAETQGRYRMIGAIVALLLAFAGGAFAFSRVSPHFRARTRVERLVMGLLLLASLIAILTTAGIVASLLFESMRFFSMVNPVEFLFGTTWSPQTAMRADQSGSSGAFGAIPLFWGTIFIGAIIAMIVAIPLGLMSAIYLTQYARPAVRRWMKPLLEMLAGVPTVVYGYFAALTVAPAVRDFVGGVLLAVSRAIGETMIVVMAAGLAANLTANPFASVTTVTTQIVQLLTGDQEFDSAKTLAAFALGLVLFIVTLLLNIVALRVVKKYREAYE